MIQLYACAGLLGICLGSFLNVVLYRIYSGRSMVTGRSMCMTCGKTLGALELIPVFSYLFLRGRCRGCKSGISFQYPLIELIAGIIAVITAWSAVTVFGYEHNLALASMWFIAVLVAGLSLLVIAIYDMKHMIIPDGAVVVLALAGVGITFLRNTMVSYSPYADVWYMPIIGALLFSGIFYALWYFTSGRGLGFGDVKLVGAIGLVLTLGQGVAAMLMAFWIGALYAIGLIVISKVRNMKGITMKSAVPFGPFLVLGAYLALFVPISMADIFLVIDFLLGAR